MSPCASGRRRRSSAALKKNTVVPTTAPCHPVLQEAEEDPAAALKKNTTALLHLGRKIYGSFQKDLQKSSWNFEFSPAPEAPVAVMPP